MNIRDIPMGNFVRKADGRHHDHVHAGLARVGRRAMSRREFARRVTGAAVVGATLGSGLWRPALADRKGPLVPVPIPGGSPALNPPDEILFHVFGPASIDPADAEPVTITNFNGFMGLAYISGMVTRTKTGEKPQRFPFVDSDMRFMTGAFQGMDGRVQRGAFALV
jgi:hypothetical protein